ncbi:hypothetical protein DFR67_10143 [Williamsia limnetica]|jgi:hypothetical protein|uniref:Uncharacterized protein n=1 Tax=Williamsia limnetica TaxID=882452 RepID=A0A318S7C1_WILLI|nr:hypothetical protein DFR67_10143 [Williamsia limnetica]
MKTSWAANATVVTSSLDHGETASRDCLLVTRANPGHGGLDERSVSDRIDDSITRN